MEAMQRRLYPIGMQTFSEVRRKNYVYVDKSLLTSTLHSYFAGQKELFEGLAIEKWETEWIEYPVLHFDMSTAKHAGKEQLIQELESKLAEYEKTYGRSESHINVNQRMEGLKVLSN